MPEEEQAFVYGINEAAVAPIDPSLPTEITNHAMLNSQLVSSVNYADTSNIMMGLKKSGSELQRMHGAIGSITGFFAVIGFSLQGTDEATRIMNAALVMLMTSFLVYSVYTMYVNSEKIKQTAMAVVETIEHIVAQDYATIAIALAAVAAFFIGFAWATSNVSIDADITTSAGQRDYEEGLKGAKNDLDRDEDKKVYI